MKNIILKNKKSAILLITLFISSCTQVTSLNLKKHQFGLTPMKIIWFQIAGLEEEQLAMLKYQNFKDKNSSFEQSLCYGKLWSYNLYRMRNSASASFLSQLTGKKNIKNSCEDSSLKPIWNYLQKNGYQTGILESGASENEELLKFKECGIQGEFFLRSTYYFARKQPKINSQTFHYSSVIPMKMNEVFYDRSCNDQGCESLMLEDFLAVYQKFKKNSSKHLFIIRDFSYLKAIKRKDFLRAQKILVDLERVYAEALRLTKSSDYLVLLTTGDSRYIELPGQGREFFVFNQKGTFARLSKSKLTNLLLASGARAENFCGIYNDAEVFERILKGPKQQGLELQMINPFKP